MMTSLTQNLTHAHGGFGLIQALRGWAHNLGRVFAAMAAGQRATTDFERQNSRTDTQLSAKGLCRADVARSVFERNFG